MNRGYSSLQRGLQVLALVQDRGRVGVAELARATDMPLSTAYRYVAALRAGGYLLDDDGLLVPGERLAENSQRAGRLADLAAAVVHSLRERTGLTALALTRVHTMAQCLAVVPGVRRHRIFHRRGQEGPLHAGGSALPLLAFAPRPVVRRVLQEPLRPFTTATPDAIALDGLLRTIRAERLSITRGFVTPGLLAVGVPVIVDGQCLASVSVVGEECDLSERAVDRLVDETRAAVVEFVDSLSAPDLEEVRPHVAC